MDQLDRGTDALFILPGAVMVPAMHAGFAFLERGTVCQENQVNALVKIRVDFALSTIVDFFVGRTVAYAQRRPLVIAPRSVSLQDLEGLYRGAMRHG